MASKRRIKKKIAGQGLTEAEFKMLELLEEVLERFRWMQVLGYTFNFLLRDRLKVPQAELDRVLKAATRAVEEDGSLKRWQDRLAGIKKDLAEGRRRTRGEIRRVKREGEDSGNPGS